ncbi:MAG: hypothetical protein AB8G86_10895 [Saprospiraceae bacterium]
MKKTGTLLILFLVIGGFTYYLTTKKDTKTTLLTEARNFAVADIDQVHKIFIADRNGKNITLERQKNHWQLNGKHRANPNAVSTLLNTIQKLKIKYTPPRTAIKNIINDIATNNIKVEIYNRSGEKIKGYYVGGVTNDELGTHMIKEDEEEPFVTYVPGFEGSLRVRYMTDEINWRDKAIFQERLSAIQSVSIEYPKQKNKSFKLVRNGKSFDLMPFYENTAKINRPLAKGQIEKYLIGYERLVAENFANHYQERDSIEQLLPFSIIRLKTANAEEKVVKLHPILKKSKTGQILLSDEGTGIVEKYFADVDGADFMLIQHLVFGKILWGYENFYYVQ